MVGEAGIGKSRLIQALLDETAADLKSSSLSMLAPLYRHAALAGVQQLGFAAGFAPDDSDEQKRKKIVSLLRRGAEDISEAAPLSLPCSASRRVRLRYRSLVPSTARPHSGNVDPATAGVGAPASYPYRR